MKKNFIAILLVCLLIVLPISVTADESINTKAAQPTPEPISPDPVPTFIPAPSDEPIPTMVPSPSDAPIAPVNPHIGHAFNGPDENGLWHSGYYSYPELSINEISNLFHSVDTTVSSSYFDVWPSVQYEPYVLGQLSQDSLDKCLAYFNIMRRLGGLNSLELNDEANMYAQYAAWLLCRNQTLTHIPRCQVDIPQEFCQNGYYGSSHSNISHSHSNHGFTNWQIDGYMSDRYGVNLSEVGHRQEILNPRLVDTGFGTAGWFHTNFVGHRSASAQIDNYDFIAWPASGNFPANTNAFERLSPWSVSIDRSNILNPANNPFVVTIYKNGVEIDELVYGIDPSFPTDPYPNEGRYITIQSTFTNNYCIIFRPDMDNITLDGTFTICISGLKHISTHEEFDITYEVNFFNIADPEYEPTILYGDVDLDGIVDSNDALITLRYTMGLIPEDEFSELSIINADIDCNGIVESNDALNILRMVLHLL